VRLYGLTGRPVTEAAGAQTVWTHPGDTGALLEFCPAGFAADPRLEPGWTTAPWRDHPLGLLRTSHVTVLFDDLAAGHRVYADVLGGAHLHTDDDNGVSRAYYAIGEDTVIEVAAPRDGETPEGRDLARAGNAVYAITFASVDLDRAAAFLDDHGVPTARTSRHDLHVALAPQHGLNLFLTDRVLPNDTRV
jgi:hypothetical protein